jgi:5'-3' exonuclease
MSLVGDVSDDVPGVKGIGPKKAVRMVSDEETLSSFIGTMEDAYNRVSSGGDIFLEGGDFPDKDWELSVENKDVVTTAFKLISFELLCRWLESENTIEKINMMKYMNTIISKDVDYISKESFIAAMERLHDCYIEEDVVKNIFREYIGEC